MHHLTALDERRRTRETTILRRENLLLRSLVESMAIGLTVDEMPEPEALMLNEILDSI
jgi:hypothetical protein